MPWEKAHRAALAREIVALRRRRRARVDLLPRDGADGLPGEAFSRVRRRRLRGHLEIPCGNPGNAAPPRRGERQTAAGRVLMINGLSAADTRYVRSPLSVNKGRADGSTVNRSGANPKEEVHRAALSTIYIYIKRQRHNNTM